MNAKTGAPQARGPLSKPLVEVIERSEDYEREEARNDASTKFWNSAAWSALILFRAQVFPSSSKPALAAGFLVRYSLDQMMLILQVIYCHDLRGPNPA